jgi:hypothetical protein
VRFHGDAGCYLKWYCKLLPYTSSVRPAQRSLWCAGQIEYGFLELTTLVHCDAALAEHLQTVCCSSKISDVMYSSTAVDLVMTW